MNDTTWVKLYRKSLSNEVRRHDPTAWRIFETLLLLVDSQTGKWSGGRYQLVEADGYLNGSTIYKALQRLENVGMISVKSNTRFSEISICKFSDYAKSGNTSSNNKVTTNEQQSNTSSNTLTRSKEVRSKNIDTKVSMAVARTPKKEIDEMFEKWESIVGYRIDGQIQKNRYACSNLLKKYGSDGVIALIRGVDKAHQSSYAPKISDFVGLQAKKNDLIRWGKEQSITGMKKVAFIS